MNFDFLIIHQGEMGMSLFTAAEYLNKYFRSFVNFLFQITQIKWAWIIVFLFSFLFLTLSESKAQEPGKQVVQSKGFHYDYLLYLPKDYGQTEDKWPLLLSLHGFAPNRPDDIVFLRNSKDKPSGIVEDPAKMKELFGEEGFTFILVSPHCPPGEWWFELYLDQVLDDVLANYAVDRKRIYLTGNSMGGCGTWSYASVHPELFAAAVPICGTSDVRSLSSDLSLAPPAALENLVDIPIWAFHGKRDYTLPFSKGESTVINLRNLGGNVEFTVYPELGHDIWERVYNKIDSDIYSWMLSFTKADIIVPLYRKDNVLATGIYNENLKSDDLAGSVELSDNNGVMYTNGELGTWIPDTKFFWKTVYRKDSRGEEIPGWKQRNFDESQWNHNTDLGFPIGYGSNGENGKLDIKVDESSLTIYTRSIFDVQNYNAITELIVKIAGDDATAVWLNGVFIGVSGESVSDQNERPENWRFDTTTRSPYYEAWDYGDPFGFSGPGTKKVTVKVNLVENVSSIEHWDLHQ